MPWWLLGISMVATTFSTDTPNLVCNFVRDNGVFGNWQWWAMLPTGMLTVFLYAKLWRRSGIITDVEFYEMRYSGKTAAFLRGFRAVYIGLFFNILIMASVTLAAIKIGASVLGLTPIQSVLGAMIVTVVFSTLGGLKGVILSDFVLFIASMIGAVAAAYFVLDMPEVGGLSGLVEKLSNQPENVRKMEVMGYLSKSDFIAVFLIPFAVIWWSVWYPGAEPGGGGYLVQRMLSAKNENHAVGATMLFNVAHYALRPWPWIIVALASLVIYPDQKALVNEVGHLLPESQIKSDVAYSLMLTKLPPGWVGLVIASLAAAYVSTISTMLNWGASYLVNDFWGRFIRPEASEKEQVRMGRVFTIILMAATGLLALCLESAVDSFNIILSIGAGTGLIFMLRWFWWRVNAAAELTGMIASFIFAIYFSVVHPKIFPNYPVTGNMNMVLGVFFTTICWVVVAFVTTATDKQKLYDFCRKINPAGPGWSYIRRQAAAENVDLSNPDAPSGNLSLGILASLVSCVMIYSVLIGTGEFLYGRYIQGIIFMAVFGVSLYFVIFLWRKINNNPAPIPVDIRKEID